MSKFETVNELNIKVTNVKETLIDETCCTALTICLNNDGDVFTSFVGAYNPEIIKMLGKVQKRYFKNLIKKLKTQNQEVVNNITSGKVENNETVEEPKKEKVKKVHERDKKKQTTKKEENNEEK